jgi:septum formation protein
LITKLPKHQLSIILASTSPRRKQLLTDASYEFKVVFPHINESFFVSEGLEPSEYAKKLALAKAKTVAAKYPDSLVIGADTIVDCNGQIIGKPTDAEDAERITRKLFSKPHKVITAVALVRLSDNREIVESDITEVYPKKMTNEQLTEHIKSESWRDKAGAYAIQEKGDEFIEKIEGSLTNVMGLPMELLQQLLQGFVD